MNLIEAILINSFIALMLLILWGWDLPERSLLNRLVMKLKWPVQRLGLFHSWRMFAPDPSIDNYRFQFRLLLADGSVVVIEPEYLRYPGAQRKPVRYRWSKIKNSLLKAESVPLRASMCKYVAAEYMAQFGTGGQQPEKNLVEVQIVRWRQRIAPLEAKATTTSEPYKQRVIYSQAISSTPAVAATAHDPEPIRLRLCRE